VAAEYGGVYAAHQRYHTLGRPAAWEETFQICRQAGVPVHVSHERVDGEAEGLLDRAQEEGLDLTFESYLYGAGMSHMTIMLPVDVQVGAPEEVAKRLRDPAVRERCLPQLRQRLGEAGQVVGFTRSGRHIGRRLRDLASQAGAAPEAFAYDLIIEEEGLCTYIFPWPGSAGEIAEAIDRTARHPMMMIASDGIYNVPHPHPRGFGCFARVLGHFARKRGLLSLKEAVHKMSGMPARRFGLTDRGAVAPGMAADLVVFDAGSVGSPATFEDPMRPPTGIDQVLVNGAVVMEAGCHTGAYPGRVLRPSR
jgi:N-acyl-D-amino-acid deacylase